MRKNNPRKKINETLLHSRLLRWTLHQYDTGTRIRADFPLRAVLELSNSLTYSGISFEPSIFAEHISADKSFYRMSISALFDNETLSDYFYQENANEVTASRARLDGTAQLGQCRQTLVI